MFFRTGRRFDEKGVAAIEFALIGPALMTVIGLMLDYSYGFSIKLKMTNAVTAASIYAFQNGEGITQANAVSFIDSVKSVVETVGDSPVPMTVEVKFNNVASSANAANFYCVTGYPPVWSSTGLQAASCAGGVQSGKFVTISVSGDFQSLFWSNPVFSQLLRVEETAIVRVQ